jgi:hypothetical protein
MSITTTNSLHSNKKIDFLLWYTLVNNINDSLEKLFTVKHGPNLYYETFGYYIKEIYDEKKKENYIINTNNDIILGYPGGFKETDQKILLFKETINKILIEKSLSISLSFSIPTFEILKLYILYFYLCELSEDSLKKSNDIFISYDPHINNYFNELWYINFLQPIIYTYKLKYDQTYNIPLEKIKIILNDNSLISNVEKNKFLLKVYECENYENELYHSVIDFYKINYNEIYTLFFYKKFINIL